MNFRDLQEFFTNNDFFYTFDYHEFCFNVKKFLRGKKNATLPTTMNFVAATFFLQCKEFYGNLPRILLLG